VSSLRRWLPAFIVEATSVESAYKKVIKIINPLQRTRRGLIISADGNRSTGPAPAFTSSRLRLRYLPPSVLKATAALARWAAVAELLVEKYPIPMKRVGVGNTFAESGPYLDVIDKYGLTVRHIVQAVHAVLRRKPARTFTSPATRSKTKLQKSKGKTRAGRIV
jgi:hypothetical protein